MASLISLVLLKNAGKLGAKRAILEIGEKLRIGLRAKFMPRKGETGYDAVRHGVSSPHPDTNVALYKYTMTLLS